MNIINQNNAVYDIEETMQLSSVGKSGKIVLTASYCGLKTQPISESYSEIFAFSSTGKPIKNRDEALEHLKMLATDTLNNLVDNLVARAIDEKGIAGNKKLLSK
jgi:hypothetical protein